MDKLHAMSDALMLYETIDEAQIQAIMKGETPPPPADWTDDNKQSNTPPSNSSDEMDQQSFDSGNQVPGET